MGAFRFAKDTLTSMRLSQLRDLARHLGVVGYSCMLRDQLIPAILTRASQVEASESIVVSPPVQPALEPPSADLQSVPVLRSPVDLRAPVDSRSAVDLPLPADLPASTPTASPLSLPSSEAGHQDPPTWVSFTAQDPQWALVSWGISAADQQRARSAGGQQLVIRLTDVTDSSAKVARPHTLQEVLVDATALEWHLPIPLGDRDYRVELGFRTSVGGWYSLAFSTVAWMPADGVVFPSLSMPFSFAELQEGTGGFSPQPASGLHERLYQHASAARRTLGQGSEGFHEQGGLLQEAAGHQHSGVGLWASGREGSGAGMAARQRNFWLVADAELIVYGATDPSATLTVAEKAVPLAQDGTFRLHMAFPDGGQNYPIRALAADGEQKRSITLDFLRTTPHAKVNRQQDAVLEWF